MAAPFAPSWVASDGPVESALAGAAAVWLVSGGPYCDDAAVLAAIGNCIDAGTPFLGTCSGFQYACLELARRAGADAAHAEVDPAAADPVIAPLCAGLYGEERTVEPRPGTRFASLCGTAPFPGYHHCGFGLAARHEGLIERAGAVIAARSADAGVEAIELPDHPFFLATAFQPQVGVSHSGVLPALLAALLAAASRTPAPAR